MHKNLKPVLVVCGIVVASVTVVYGSFMLGGLLEKPKEKQATCDSSTRTEHKVNIENDAMSPQHTKTALCDTLTITNLDDKVRRVAFGRHEKHVVYDGVEETLLLKGRSFTVTLRQSGEYLFHDHNQEEVRGTFEVAP